MAKRSTSTRKPAASSKQAPAAKHVPSGAEGPAEAAAAEADNQAAPESAAAETEIPAAGGAGVKPEGAAASEGGTEAKAPESETSSGAADPAGTEAAPAAASEESREQAGAASADRKDEAEEGNEPGETAWPPVAGPEAARIVVTGPRKGFRRSGIAFGPEPKELRPADFEPREGETAAAAAARLLAVLEEPNLKCVVRLEDGREELVVPEMIAHLRAAVERAASDD